MRRTRSRVISKSWRLTPMRSATETDQQGDEAHHQGHSTQQDGLNMSAPDPNEEGIIEESQDGEQPEDSEGCHQ